MGSIFGLCGQACLMRSWFVHPHQKCKHQGHTHTWIHDIVLFIHPLWTFLVDCVKKYPEKEIWLIMIGRRKAILLYKYATHIKIF